MLFYSEKGDRKTSKKKLCMNTELNGTDRKPSNFFSLMLFHQLSLPLYLILQVLFPLYLSFGLPLLVSGTTDKMQEIKDVDAVRR